VLHVWAGIAFGAGFLLFPAMQADVIDYDELHTGQRREAQFTAFWALVPKLVAIPGAALPIALLAQLGYVPNQDQSPAVLLGIRVIYALVPAACASVAFFLGRQYNVTQQVHEKIRAGIAAHGRGESAVDPLNGRVIPPPSARLVDAETAWFLDHFSPGELRRVAERGAAGLRGLVTLKAGACLGLAVAAVGTCIATLPAVHEEPGLLPVLSVVAAGFSLTGAAFHALRLRPAARLAAQPIAPELLRAHLEQTQRSAPRSDAGSEALQRAS
jgi:MFS transporter